jgi:hypothetical protein
VKGLNPVDEGLLFGTADFRVRAAFCDCTVRGALSLPHLKGAGHDNPGPCQARDSSAAPGNTQDMEAM